MHTKLKIIVVLAILVAVMPFIGISIVWRVWIAAALALGIAVVGYKLLREVLPEDKKEDRYNGEPTYVESQPSNQPEATSSDSHEA